MIFKRKWLAEPENSSPGTHPGTFGLNKCWTFRGAQRMARRYGKRTGITYEVYGPAGKGIE
jgi:hypothetical protein